MSATPEEKRALLFRLAATMEEREVLRIGVSLVLGALAGKADPHAACDIACDMLRDTLAKILAVEPEEPGG
jgi:hypothetical protein